MKQFEEQQKTEDGSDSVSVHRDSNGDLVINDLNLDDDAMEDLDIIMPENFMVSQDLVQENFGSNQSEQVALPF